MARIWAITKDPGGHAAVWPVSEMLTYKHSVLNISEGAAVEIMNKPPNHLRLYLGAWDPQDVLNLVDTGQLNLPDVFVTSACSGGGVGMYLIPKMKARGVPTVVVTDFWAGAQVKDFNPSKFWPSAICVQDELAKKFLMRAWRGYPENNVHITGQPAFDEYASLKFDKQRILKQVKRQIPDFKDIPTVFFAGQLQGSTEALSSLIRALNVVPNPINLVLSKHPRFHTHSPEENDPWDKACREFHNGYLVYTELISLKSASEKISSDEWVCISDVVVSMHSTLLATAGYFRKECVSILFPDVEKRDLGKWGLPYEHLDTAVVCRTHNQVAEALRDALRGGLGLMANQKKHFALPGDSTERVVRIVEKLIEGGPLICENYL
ncbi:MAG: hypothetical protein A3B96_01340 [Candidatus Spechtbacteria bacterium RIFCSPHIGHO2_02_FULL_43_15b]|uniref:UDP-N-acetylglucosamine 2-epimerase domain-containing protein n=1 Tax=Candidatus Spechtbacteria bacterium RIFCSPHIGHO2_01_FULL_43_30 TaxID=1802158 RepID=A0A1G2H4U5_9BACT|nr:MAG: hypothetical protein A2827_03745 [Candidatus Spechtbacteria bacterium RIFCSPHIGHO2_01_FULL_43_30]OGZ59055.1 MAG: hypothetical protein A3B96_01340 [Candidatus Spechtbacteria bacterium RIFCSPHIGHO2_02_FULL_43_15b]